MFGLCFVLKYFVSFLVLQLFRLRRECLLLNFCCVLNVMLVLLFFLPSPLVGL